MRPHLKHTVLCVALATAGCSGSAQSTDPPAPAAASTEHAARGSVRLEPSQLKHVRVEEIAGSAPADAIKATGTIEFNADRMAKLLPPVPGQVQNLTVNVGDTVHRHDVVFVLSSREVAAAIADQVASHKDLDLSQKTLAMTRDLFEHGAASRIALQQAESEVAKAQSKVAQTDQVLEVLGLDVTPDRDGAGLQPRIPIRAPIDGTVIDRSVTNGQFVAPEGGSLVTVADLSTVWVQADVFERDLRSISAGEPVDVTTDAYPSDHFSAQVARVGSVVDPQTHTAKVRFLVANPGARLKPGMFASIELFVNGQAPSLTVPVTAVFVENTHTFAYVQTGALEFSRREIETATADGDRLKVIRGLSHGDRVVSDGVLLLRQLETDASDQ
jgi:membrane fusion protein, heavy metal efflux system